MKINSHLLRKIFSMRMMQKAIQTFDRTTMVVVVTCWSSALLIMLLAVYTLSLSVTAKREAIEAASMEPAIPKVLNKPPSKAELQPLFDRLQKRFSDLSFAMGNDMSLTVSSNDGSKFRTWLTVLSYIDTISPQYRWTMKEFCVGLKCGSSSLMRATVLAEKITFAAPVISK